MVLPRKSFHSSAAKVGPAKISMGRAELLTEGPEAPAPAGNWLEIQMFTADPRNQQLQATYQVLHGILMHAQIPAGD